MRFGKTVGRQANDGKRGVGGFAVKSKQDQGLGAIRCYLGGRARRLDKGGRWKRESGAQHYAKVVCWIAGVNEFVGAGEKKNSDQTVEWEKKKKRMKTKMQMATFANGRDSGYPTEARWKTQKVVIAGGTRGSSQAEPKVEGEGGGGWGVDRGATCGFGAIMVAAEVSFIFIFPWLI